MKIRGTMCIKSNKIIGYSLMPDNLPNIKTKFYEKSFEVSFSADNIGTILSSIDDYLMNAKISQEILKK